MFKVMIVEDEALVRIGLKNAVDWDKHGMAVCADAPNGAAALALYDSEHPDLIITDIKMPVMDGMELIRRIREKDDRTMIVILTCLEEFGLLKQAMTLGVTDYILKLTTTEEELDALLEKLRNTLESRVSSAPESAVSKGVLAEQLIKDYLFYQSVTPEAFAEQAKRLALRLSPERLMVALMGVDDYGVLKAGFEDEKGYLTNFALMNMAAEILGNSGEIVHEEGARYFLLLNVAPEDADKAQPPMLRTIGKAAEQYFGTSVSFGISEVCDGFAHLHALYRQAEEALLGKFVHGPGKIHTAGDGDKKLLMRERLEPLARLDVLLGIEDVRFSQRLCGRIERIAECSPADAGAIKEALGALQHWIVEQVDIAGEDVFACLIAHGQAIQAAECMGDAVGAVIRFVNAVKHLLLAKEKVREEIAKAVQYIETHFHEDISLGDVAAHVGLSPSYFSSLFKKEMAANLTEYLNETRIREAMRLLRDTKLKTYEISERVGFRECAYFSTLFKRATGQSPSKYRQRWRAAGKA